MFYQHIMESAEFIKQKTSHSPKIGIVLGSGLGALIDIIEDKEVIAYSQIPHFPQSHVEGHAGNLVLGRIGGQTVVCMQGRFHYYEGFEMKEVTYPIYVMKQLGVDIPISSTDNIARLLEREVDSARIKSLLSLNRGEASLSEMLIPDNYVLHGKRLFELDIPEDAVIAAIFRDDKLIIPRGNAQIMSGDKILVIAKDRIIHELSESLKLK